MLYRYSIVFDYVCIFILFEFVVVDYCRYFSTLFSYGETDDGQGVNDDDYTTPYVVPGTSTGSDYDRTKSEKRDRSWHDYWCFCFV